MVLDVRYKHVHHAVLTFEDLAGSSGSFLWFRFTLLFLENRYFRFGLVPLAVPTHFIPFSLATFEALTESFSLCSPVIRFDTPL